MKTKKPLDNIIIFISPTCVHCHNLIKNLPLNVFLGMKIIDSTKVSKKVQDKIPHVPYIIDKNGKPLKIKGKITYEKLMKFSNSFGENIQKYKKIVDSKRPKGISIKHGGSVHHKPKLKGPRLPRPNGPRDNVRNNKFGKPSTIGTNQKILKCRKFGRPASIKESSQMLKTCKKRKFGRPATIKESEQLLKTCKKRKFGRLSLTKIMSKNNAGYRKPIIKPGDTVTISSNKKGKVEVSKS